MLNKIDLSRVDLNLFVLFEAVLAEGHVGRAAQRMNLSPSAVSHGLGRLRLVLNDPLFLKHPKGVVPTAQAIELAEPIAAILAQARNVVGMADRFDPAASRRRFVIGMPDAAAGVVLPPLVSALAERAPGIDLNILAQLPQNVFAELDSRAMDIAIQPMFDLPPRFASAKLYNEDFVIAMRAHHPLAEAMDLADYCAASHVLVSLSGDPFGLVDEELRKIGESRRIAATVPQFLLALEVVSATDLIAAVPRRHASSRAQQFGLALVEPPQQLRPLGHATIGTIASRSALADAGVAWLFQTIASLQIAENPEFLKSDLP